MIMPMPAMTPMEIQAFFGIAATALKASAKIIRMPVPLEFFAFFLAMSHFNLEKWVLAQWQYPTISRPEPWGKQSEWSEKLIKKSPLRSISFHMLNACAQSRPASACDHSCDADNSNGW
jgi:hypothetical protein